MQFENPVGDAPPADRSSPAPWPSNPVRLRRRIATAASSAVTYILTSFALHAVGMYPELSWPLLEELYRLNRRNSPEDPPPTGAPEPIATEEVREVPLKRRPVLESRINGVET
jgi:hypothetical protein